MTGVLCWPARITGYTSTDTSRFLLLACKLYTPEFTTTTCFTTTLNKVVDSTLGPHEGGRQPPKALNETSVDTDDCDKQKVFPVVYCVVLWIVL
jgi:hypothetical protein